MSRPDSVQQLMLCHMDWEEDHLVIEEQGRYYCYNRSFIVDGSIIAVGHKGDQQGTMKYGKAVYANPSRPAICPILATAVHIFSSTLTHKLFEGSCNADRFGHILAGLFKGLTAVEQLELGTDIDDLGTYSLRKGSSCHVLDQTDGPSEVTVNFRMGHSNGALNDRYWSQQPCCNNELQIIIEWGKTIVQN